MIYQFVSAIFVVCKHTDILMVVIFIHQGHCRQLDAESETSLVVLILQKYLYLITKTITNNSINIKCYGVHYISQIMVQSEQSFRKNTLFTI